MMPADDDCPCRSTRGARINRRASLGARLVYLRERSATLAKESRKTPPRTLHTERARVAAAKVAFEAVRIELIEGEAEYTRLLGWERDWAVLSPGMDLSEKQSTE